MKNSGFSKFLQRLHKISSLLIVLYALWMAASGIFLNHPQVIKNLSFSNRIMPDNYQYRNWNRMSWRCAQFSTIDDNVLYVGGKQGVWRSFDQGQNFSPLTAGFPSASYEMDTFSLLLANDGKKETLLAGTRSGLCFFGEEKWQKVEHPVLGKTKVVDLIQVDDLIFAFTDSLAFTADISQKDFSFRPFDLPRHDSSAKAMPLFRWLRTVHDGSILGLPGRLLADFIGLIIIFLSLSGLIIWYTRKQKRRRQKTVFAGSLFSFNYRWHLKLGIVSALLVLILVFSGAFSFPPLLVTIVRLVTPACLIADKDSENPWREQIQRAAYLKSHRRLIIATRNGFFSGPLDHSREFLQLPETVPVHGMGVQVLTNVGDNKLLIGSFSGLYLWDTENQMIMELKVRNKVGIPDWGREIMVTGVAVFADEPILVADYESGVQSLRQHGKIYPRMPEIIASESRISLWHALFELHNGRIFEQYIGPLYWLITPLGAGVFFIIVVSGVLFWLGRRTSWIN